MLGRSYGGKMATRLDKFLKLLCPAERVESVPLIDLAELKRRHICALIMDLDNTLVPWRTSEIAPEIARWIREVKSQGMKICIVSNTRSWDRLRKLAAEMSVSFVERSLKPRRGGFREALKQLDVEPTRAAVVGDQILTDILGGNRLGLHTILVRPLRCREFVGTKISRFFEGIILKVLQRRGILDSRDVESRMRGNNRE